MLKIRNDFDLEKLKEYGFKTNYGSNSSSKFYAYIISERNYISICEKSRDLYIYVFNSYKIYDKLYDLIKDGVVIKV